MYTITINVGGKETTYLNATAEQIMSVRVALAKPVAQKHNGRGRPAGSKTKKHQYKKACEECGKKCRGRMGLGIHRKKAHGTA